MKIHFLYMMIDIHYQNGMKKLKKEYRLKNKILEVTIQDCSSIDQSKFIVAYDNIPIFENDHWILKFTIEEMDVVVSVKPAAI